MTQRHSGISSRNLEPEHTFKIIGDEAGQIVKMKASISNYKDVTINRLNDKCYVHLSDV